MPIGTFPAIMALGFQRLPANSMNKNGQRGVFYLSGGSLSRMVSRVRSLDVLVRSASPAVQFH